MIEQDEIPEDWDIKEMSDLGRFQNGKFLPKKDMVDDGDYPVYGGNGVMGHYDDYWVEEDCIVIGRVGMKCGTPHMADSEIWATDNSIVFWPDDDIIKEYIYRFLQNYDFDRIRKQSAQSLIAQRDVKDIEVPVPPLDEQERIVESMEERLERVGRLEKSVKNVGRLAVEYEKSLLSFLTIGRDVTEESAVDGIPENQSLPVGWDASQLSEVTKVNPRISYNEYEDYAYVPMDAVSADKKAITRYERRESLYSGLSKFCEGDIIVARITPCFENGKMAMVSDLPDSYEFAVGSTEFVVIRPTDINPEYLFLYLKSPIVRQWGKHRLLGATGRERIKISQFRNDLTVPVPPEETQSRIVQKIKRNDYDKIRMSVNAVQNMFREYQDSVLAHATKGKI